MTDAQAKATSLIPILHNELAAIGSAIDSQCRHVTSESRVVYKWKRDRTALNESMSYLLDHLPTKAENNAVGG